MSKADRPKGNAGKTRDEIKTEVSRKLEREIQSDIIGYLRTRDIFVISQRFDKRSRTTVGTPDIIFVFKGTPFAWEVKALHGFLSSDQQAVSEAMLKDGWHWHLVRSVQQAKEILDSTPSASK